MSNVVSRCLVCHLQASCTTAKLEEVMARLVAVCREGEEDYPFLARQIPLYIDDTLTVNKLPHILYMTIRRMFMKITGAKWLTLS